MNPHRKLLVGTGAALALAAGGTGVAVAVSGGGEQESGKPVPAAAAAQAKTVALKVTGGGTVTALERDSENGATYEVEVTTPGGRSVDVRLDDAFALVGQPEPSGDAGEQADGQVQGEHGEQADGPEHGETNDD